MPITSVDVVVPRSLVPSIYGEDGGCLRHIREVCVICVIVHYSDLFTVNLSFPHILDLRSQNYHH